MISLYDLTKAANGQLFGQPAAQLFTDFCLDPGRAAETLLYVALRTDQGDTHHYIPEAIENGVSGVICTHPPDCDTSGVTVVMVPDTVEALMKWAHFTLGKQGIKTIGIAGSTGKSTAAVAISGVLGTRYRVLTGDVDQPGRLSLALSLAHLKPEHEFAVFKLDTTHPGEMASMVETIRPDVGVITSIDCVHPAGFDNCSQFIAEMAVLVDYLSPGALLALNFDDEEVSKLKGRARSQVRTVGTSLFGADLLAFNINHGIGRTGFDLRYEQERYLGRWTPVPGKDHLYSMLLALAVGQHHHILLEDGLRSLTLLEPLSGRMNALEGRNGSIIVDDTYRATVSSTLNALEWLRQVRLDGQRLFLVVGDMDNLGRNSQFGHRMVGRQAAEIVDVIITRGSEAALVGRAAIDEGKNSSSIHTTYSSLDAVAALEAYNLTEQDIILVKGGESARMEHVVKELLANPAQVQALVQRDDLEKTPVVFRPLHSSWLEIDSGALASNLRLIRSALDAETRLMAVVKSDAYGHGAIMAARTALMSGADYLAVSSIDEAFELRDAGIDAPILVMTYLPVHALRQAIQQNITASVYDLHQARLYDRAARYITGRLKYHVKLDTGMGRLGIMTDEAVTVFRHLQAMSNLELEGIYTHFSVAESDAAYTLEQVDTFKYTVRLLRAAGFKFQYIHASNSAGLIRSGDYHFNMVRPGLLLYGLHPGGNLGTSDALKPVMTWKTSVAQVKTFPPGYPIGYGNTYRTTHHERVAILPVGYADGLRRSPNTWREVLIHGQRAPLVGRVSMEKCAVSVDHISEVSIGDEVVLLGKQGNDEITADEIADWLETINYEVVTMLSGRIPRVFI